MKRYPRTLNDAFPNTMEYGASITKFYHKPTLLEIAMTVVSIVGFVVLLLDIFYWRAV
jgi:hypothetical protein